MLQRAYNWSLSKAAHPHAKLYLWATAFLESFVSPIPPDPILIPMVLAKKHKAWSYAFLCTSGSILGGVIGYYIGLAFFDTLGSKILDMYSLHAAFDKLKIFFQKYGFWIILLKGFTPIPFKVVTITSGATQVSLLPFIAASVISRGLRYYLEAYLFWRWGAPMQAVLEKNLRLIMIAGTLLLVVGYVIIRYLI